MSYHPTVKKFCSAVILTVVFLLSGKSTIGQLIFRNATLETASNTNLKAGAVYRFSQVAPNIDALVRIDSLVNGASVTAIDVSNTGYNDAFQPSVRPGSIGISYALFTISFVREATNSSVFLTSVTATNLDLDGTALIKELCEIDMVGGTSTFMSNNPQISVNLLSGKFRGLNLLGRDYSGIDTTAHAVMYKVQRNNVSSFQVRFGALTTGLTSSARMFSLYMKEFQISNATTLPVDLLYFQATLKDKSATLNWTTTNHLNFSHFVIERSTDAKSFSEAAILFADNNSNIENSFSFKDNLKNATSKIFYYRLKMVDADGKYNYSETRIVRLSNETNNNLQISTFPNPVVNEVRIQIPDEWQNKKVAYEVYNNSGILVQRYLTNNATQVQQLNMQQFNAGNYIVRVSNGSSIISSKIIK